MDGPPVTEPIRATTARPATPPPRPNMPAHDPELFRRRSWLSLVLTQATVDGTTVAGGGPALLRERSLDLAPGSRATVDRWSARGATASYLVRDGQVIGAFALEDEVRPEAREAVEPAGAGERVRAVERQALARRGSV